MPQYFDFLGRVSTLWLIEMAVAPQPGVGPFLVDPFEPSNASAVFYVVTSYPTQVPDALLGYQRWGGPRKDGIPPDVPVAVRQIRCLGPLYRKANEITPDVFVDIQEPPEATPRRP